jgi:hypothetical protein
MQAHSSRLGEFKQGNAAGRHANSVEEAMTARRFPPPWRVVDMAGCFIVQDATGQNVAWFHFHDDATVAPLLKERVRRRAVNFAGRSDFRSEGGSDQLRDTAPT